GTARSPSRAEGLRHRRGDRETSLLTRWRRLVGCGPGRGQPGSQDSRVAGGVRTRSPPVAKAPLLMRGVGSERSAPRTPHPDPEETMNIRLGSAPDSWGVWFPSDPKQIHWHRFLDEIAQAGYEWTELGPYGYLPTELATLRAELARRGLKVTAAFAMGHLEDPEAWPALEKQA